MRPFFCLPPARPGVQCCAPGVTCLASELDRQRPTIRKDDPQMWGSLYVLRKGFKHINATFRMAQFAPANSRNPKLWSDFNGNILRVVRQVRYSLHNTRSIDLVLFINGIPVATIELKTETTQSIEAAGRQYRADRPPVDPVSNMAEPLLGSAGARWCAWRSAATKTIEIYYRRQSSAGLRATTRCRNRR